MVRGVTDTTVFIARPSGRPLGEQLPPDKLAVSVITIGELRTGMLVASDVRTRGQRLTTLEIALAIDPLSIDGTVAEPWARLRVLLREAGRNMALNDSWIAATAMALGVVVVSRYDDYVELDELSVIRV